MQIFNLLPLAFLATSVLAKPLAKRDFQTVVDDVNDVSAKVVKLNNTVTQYQGGNNGFIQAIQIQTQSQDVLNALNKTTNDANASPNWDNEQSVAVGIAVLDLQPNVISLLDNIKSKKATFDSGFFPLSPIVLKSLKDQRAATVNVSVAITNKLSDEWKPVSPEITKPIFDKFDEVIKVYSQFSWGGN